MISPIIGQRIALRGGLLAEFLGLAGSESATVNINGVIKTVPRSLIKGRFRTPHKWPIGLAVTVDLETVRGGKTVVAAVGGEVISSATGGESSLKVRITEADPLWFGCVVTARDGKVRRVGE